MKNRKGHLLILTGLLLIAAALFLVAFNLYEEQKAALQSSQVLSEMPDTDPGSTVPDYVIDPNRDMPTVKIDGRDYIGVLAIPDLELVLPVMSQWSYPGLRIAPCRYTGSAYLDNLVIAGHNYPRHFGHLKDLSGGETVTFTDADGNAFLYQVVQVETLMPTDVEEMENSDWDLTLFTCTIGGSYRVTVRCERITENTGM